MINFQFDTLKLAFLVSKYTLTNAHLCHISECYKTLTEAVDDKFNTLDAKKCQAKNKLITIDTKIFEAPFAEFGQLLEDNQIKVISYQDSQYPSQFTDLPNPPIILYYQGDLDLLAYHRDRMTIIGSRNIKPYTQIILPYLLNSSINQGLITVSGLALGVDSLVHSMSVGLHKPTIGIIGSGLDNMSFYPFENLGLKAQILENGGLVLSEYAPNTPPNRYNFPHRNRLLAAISPICFVAQASLKSGSLITATQAQKLERTIISLPANLTEGGFEGNLELLQSRVSSLILTPENIQSLLGYTNLEKPKTPAELKPKSSLDISTNNAIILGFDSQSHQQIWNILSAKPINIEDLQKQSGLELGELQGVLTSLELDGLVVSVGSNDWVRG